MPVAPRFHDLLIGRHCGIVRRIREIPRRWDDPNVFIVGAELADIAAFGATAAPSHAGGVGLTHDDAWCGAIGEAAERYCAALGPSRLLARVRAWTDFEPAEAVDPETLALFSEQQHRQEGFPIRPFHRDTPTAWLPGWHLITPVAEPSKPCWILADCVGLGGNDRSTGGPINVPTSTGLAAAQTLEQAVLAGVCEVIERDSFVVAWRNGLSTPRVDLHAHALDWLRDLLEQHLLWPRIEYYIADLTADTGIPVYAVISRGRSEDGTVVSFGAACHPVARVALTKALLEAAMGRAYVRQLLRRQPVKRYRRDLQDVCTFDDHAQFYTRHPRYWTNLRRLVNRKQLANLDTFSSPSADEHDALRRISEKLRDLGLASCWCELTTPDVAAAGLHVVRVLVPGMQPLHGDHRLPFLGGSRGREPNRVFNWAGTTPLRRQRQVLPHPYP